MQLIISLCCLVQDKHPIYSIDVIRRRSIRHFPPGFQGIAIAQSWIRWKISFKLANRLFVLWIQTLVHKTLFSSCPFKQWTNSVIEHVEQNKTIASEVSITQSVQSWRSSVIFIFLDWLQLLFSMTNTYRNNRVLQTHLHIFYVMLLDTVEMANLGIKSPCCMN